MRTNCRSYEYVVGRLIIRKYFVGCAGTTDFSRLNCGLQPAPMYPFRARVPAPSISRRTTDRKRSLKMAASRKIERSLLKHQEYEDVSRTHLPELISLDDAALTTLQRQVREIRRGISGRKEPWGSSFPGSEERPSQRKKVFSSALKRISGGIARATAERPDVRCRRVSRKRLPAELGQALGHTLAPAGHLTAGWRRSIAKRPHHL